MKKLLLLGLLSGLPAACRALYWYENFDAFKPGVITANPGWQSTLGGDLWSAGWVNADHPYSAPHALELKPISGLITAKQIGVYSNLTYAYRSGTGYMLRVSARLYRDNRNQYVSINLGTNGTAKLRVATDTDGSILVNTNDTGVFFVTGRYATVTLYHDFSANKSSLDYNGTNILKWTHCGTTAFSNFNMVWYLRTKLGATDSGAVFFDDVSVEVFPPRTLAWWRFEEQGGHRTAEHTGRISPCNVSNSTWYTPTWDRLWNEQDVARNEGGLDQFTYGRAACKKELSASSWFLEMIVKISPSQLGKGWPTLFGWAPTNYSTSAAHSEIMLIWDSSPLFGQTNILYLQDSAAPTYQQIDDAVPLPADGAWHHIALWKAASHLYTYYDYRLYGSFALNTNADGNYTFYTNDVVWMDYSTNTLAGTAVDEVRFSDGGLVEGEAPDWLKLPQPEIIAPESNPSKRYWDVWMRTLPQTSNRLEICTNLVRQAPWFTLTNFFAHNFSTGVRISVPTNECGAIRVRKTW